MPGRGLRPVYGGGLKIPATGRSPDADRAAAQDLRSPDARDVAAGRVAPQATVPVAAAPVRPDAADAARADEIARQMARYNSSYRNPEAPAPAQPRIAPDSGGGAPIAPAIAVSFGLCALFALQFRRVRRRRAARVIA